LRQFFAYGQGGARFHSSGDTSGFGESVAFHLRLPMFVGPELVRNGLGRGARLLGLFVLWEVANLAGFLTAILRHSATSTTPMQASQGENSL
jgi:hypothetical protein